MTCQSVFSQKLGVKKPASARILSLILVDKTVLIEWKPGSQWACNIFLRIRMTKTNAPLHPFIAWRKRVEDGGFVRQVKCYTVTVDVSDLDWPEVGRMDFFYCVTTPTTDK